MEAILPTKKMVVEAGLASSEDGGRIKKDAEVQEVQEGVAEEEETVPVEKAVQMVGRAEVQIRTSEVSNNSKIQTSTTSKFDQLESI